MSDEFFRTRMGAKFYESDVPRIAAALERIANALNEPRAPTREPTLTLEQAAKGLPILPEYQRGGAMHAGKRRLPNNIAPLVVDGCDYEGCDERATRHRCAEHTPFVEQVWVVTNLDSRAQVDDIEVYANEGKARERVVAAIKAYGGSGELRAHWLINLEKWDGQSDVVIGPFRVRTATVML